MITRKFVKLITSLSLGALLLTGCTQPAVITAPVEIPAVDQFETVRKVADDYLTANKVRYITPDQLFTDFVKQKNPSYMLVDIRATEDFIANNIKGSINIPYAQTANLNKVNNLPKDKTIIVIDYNGHWAAQTAATWNMLGYKAVPLLYGLQSWTNNEAALGYDLFPNASLTNALDTESVSLGEFILPELKLAKNENEEIIRSLSASYLDRNYKGYITAEELISKLAENTADSYLVDIRKADHYNKGHIKGSVNIVLDQLTKTESLKALPPDQKIIIVGYDGMDASQAARILITLGYDAVALKYGISYWHGEENITGASPLRSTVKEDFALTPLNYTKPSTGAAGCG